MLAGRAADVKRHRWFEGFDWEALAAKKVGVVFEVGAAASGVLFPLERWSTASHVEHAVPASTGVLLKLQRRTQCCYPLGCCPPLQMAPPRRPKDDAAKRIREMAVRSPAAAPGTVRGWG